MSYRLGLRGCRFLLLLAVAAAWWPNSAFAYLDPASGSLLLQLILGGAAGAAVAVRLFWRRIVGLLSHRNSDQRQD
jgi:hypothetical protein